MFSFPDNPMTSYSTDIVRHSLNCLCEALQERMPAFCFRTPQIQPVETVVRRLSFELPLFRRITGPLPGSPEVLAAPI